MRFGLNAIKGIGGATVRAVTEARRSARYTSLFDFTSRIGQGAVNRRGLESLITSGAFDSLKPANIEIGQWRASNFAAIDDALAFSQKKWNDLQRGQNDLFGGDPQGDSPADISLPDVEPWSQSEVSLQEKASIGFYLSVHPLDNYQTVLSDLGIKAGDQKTFAGIVSAFQVRQSKKGNRFGMFRLEDQSTGIKCLAWSEAYSKYADVMKNDQLLIVDGRVESAEGQEITFIVSDARSLADAVPRNARAVSIHLPEREFSDDYFQDLFSLLSNASGKCEVFIDMPVEGVRVRLHSQPIRVQGSSRLENDLRTRGCEVNWVL